MKMANSSQGVATNYMDTVDVCDIIHKARQSDPSSSRVMSHSKENSIWQFKSSLSVRLPYRTSLWSLLLKGLGSQAEWFETWATLLHEAQLKNISDSELFIEFQALRNG